eukprot:1216561-Karenia_brevis.AAC.1
MSAATKRRLSLSARSCPGGGENQEGGTVESEGPEADKQRTRVLAEAARRKKDDNIEMRLTKVERQLNSGRVICRNWDKDAGVEDFWSSWNELMSSKPGQDLLGSLVCDIDDDYYDHAEIIVFQSSRIQEVVQKMRTAAIQIGAELSILPSVPAGMKV